MRLVLAVSRGSESSRFFKLQIIDRGYDPECLSGSAAHGVERDHPASIRCVNRRSGGRDFGLSSLIAKGDLSSAWLDLHFSWRRFSRLARAACRLVEDEFSSAKVAELIDARDGSESMVIAQGDPNEKTTLFFYLHRPIFWVDGHPNIEFATRTLGIGRDHYLTREQVQRHGEKPNRYFW